MSVPINNSLNRILFNAIPSIALIVDSDVRILDYNDAASKLLGNRSESVLNQRGGEALHCIHSHEVPDGCGHAPHCKNCVIRNSVKEAVKGNSLVRQRTRLDLVHGDKIDEVFALITASPFVYDDNKLVLLLIEDISEIVELQCIIPICMSCKKVRNDEQYWTEVATYFSKHLDLQFSHGYCPDCAAKEFAKLKDVLDKM
jgi:hypothetical protein